MKENTNPCPHRVIGDPCPSCQEKLDVENNKEVGLSRGEELQLAQNILCSLDEITLDLSNLKGGDFTIPYTEKNSFIQGNGKSLIEELAAEPIRGSEGVEDWKEIRPEVPSAGPMFDSWEEAIGQPYTTTITVPKNRSENPTTNIVSFDDDDFDNIEDLTVGDCNKSCNHNKVKCTHKNGYTTLVRGKIYCTECIIELLDPVREI